VCVNKNHFGLSPDIADSAGKDYINAFFEVVWCIDGMKGKKQSSLKYVVYPKWKFFLSTTNQNSLNTEKKI